MDQEILQGASGNHENKGQTKVARAKMELEHSKSRLTSTSEPRTSRVSSEFRFTMAAASGPCSGTSARAMFLKRSRTPETGLETPENATKPSRKARKHSKTHINSSKTGPETL